MTDFYKIIKMWRFSEVCLIINTASHLSEQVYPLFTPRVESMNIQLHFYDDFSKYSAFFMLKKKNANPDWTHINWNIFFDTTGTPKTHH